MSTLVNMPIDILAVIAGVVPGSTAMVALRHTCKWFAAVFPAPMLPQDMVCNDAASGGYLNFLEWAKDTRYTWSADTAAACARDHPDNALSVMKYLVQRHCPVDKRAYEWAADHGDLDMLCVLESVGCPVGNAGVFAAGAGHLDICKWLYNVHGDDVAYQFRFAVDNNHAEIVEWIIQPPVYVLRYTVCIRAAQCGNLDIFKKYYNRGIDGISGHFAQDAAAAGHINILQWLVSGGGTMIMSYVGRDAAIRGRINVLKWFKDQGMSINHANCLSAAHEYNQSECYDWLKENHW